MLFFRSEEHIDRWCTRWTMPRGAVMTLSTSWRLAKSWYHDRLRPDWARRSAAEINALFGRVGLHGEFWHLPT